jgi:hypothetical protein
MNVRAGEARFHNHFRCDRFLKINSQWHFTTREQTVEGPFPTRHAALAGLKRYLDMAKCRVFNSNERGTINQMKIVR